MKRLFVLFFFFGFWGTIHLLAQDQTEIHDLFMAKCGICHSIGMGKVIGPDLAYVHQKRDSDWLLNFIRSSQQMIKAGDQSAVALYEEYNKVIMPDPMISDNEIKSIIQFITDNSGGQVGNAALLTSILDDATPADLQNGTNLYSGRERFENRGPSCISCHPIQSKFYPTDNHLSSKNPIASFVNLGEIGIKSILDNPPFPAMAKAYESKELTEAEVHDVLIYLKEADAKDESATIASLSGNFLVFGLAGSVLLILSYSFIWFYRKDQSVNEDIYKRQIKSFN